MKKIIATLAVCAVAQLSTAGIAQMAAKKPVAAKPVAVKPAATAPTLDQEEALCAFLLTNMVEEDKSLTAEEKTSLSSMAYFYFGRVNARTNMGIQPIMDRLVTPTPQAKKIMQDEKYKETFGVKCVEKSNKLLGV